MKKLTYLNTASQVISCMIVMATLVINIPLYGNPLGFSMPEQDSAGAAIHDGIMDMGDDANQLIEDFGLSNLEDLYNAISAVHDATQELQIEVDQIRNDIPELESCCTADQPDCIDELIRINKFIKMVYSTLESNHRKHIIKMKKYELYSDAMSGVASQSAPAAAAVSAMKSSNSSNSINAALGKWLSLYDERTKNNIEKLYGALLKINELEQEYCNNTSWLKIHAFTFIIAIKAHYERDGAKISFAPPEMDSPAAPDNSGE